MTYDIKLVPMALNFGMTNANTIPPIVSFYWTDRLPEYVKKACINGLTFIFDCLWGTENIEGELVIWILVGFNVLSAIGKKPVLWSYYVISNDDSLTNKDIRKYLNCLQQQRELTLCLPIDSIFSLTMPIMQGDRLQQLQQAIAKLSNESLLAKPTNKIQINQIYDALLSKMMSLVEDKTKKMRFRCSDTEEMHLYTLRRYIEEHVSLDISDSVQHFVYHLLAENSNEFLKIVSVPVRGKGSLGQGIVEGRYVPGALRFRPREGKG